MDAVASREKSYDFPIAMVFFAFCGISAFNAYRSGDWTEQVEYLSSVPINLLAGFAFLVRRPPIEGAMKGERLVPAASFAMPFLVTNNIIFLPGQYSTLWGFLPVAVGIALSVASIAYLRMSFAVLPAVRGVVDKGPYAHIRHPLYLGEAIYLLGAMLILFNVVSVIFYIVSIALVLARIGIEERKLKKYPAYAEYMLRVRKRLIPGIY